MAFTPEIRRQTTGSGTCVLELVGEHDLATVEKLRAELGEALASSSGVVVDLTETTFIDSSVIHALFDARKVLEARRQVLVIQIAEPSVVLRPLELTGLTDAVAIVSDREEAVLLASHKAGS